MRRLTLFCAAFTMLLSASDPMAASEIQWLGNIEQAKQVAQQSGKLVLVHFWSTTCPPCVRLEREVYSQPGIGQEIAQQYVPVKIKAEDHPGILKQYQVRFVPTDVVLNASGRIVVAQGCPIDRAQYISGLNRIAVAQRAQIRPNVNVAARAMRPSGYAALAPGQPRPTSNPEQSQAIPPSNPFAGQQGAVPASHQTIAGAPLSSRPAAPGSGGYPPNGPSMNAPVTGNSVAVAQYGSPTLPQSGFQHSPARQPDIVPPVVNRPPYQPQVAANVPPAAATAPEPTLALDGTCPVELKENERWVQGDKRWGAVHRGRIYLFTGQSQQQRFLSRPDYYAPALSGNDPVLALDRQQLVAGLREYGLFYNDRVYLFADQNTLAQFQRSPERYLAGVQEAESLR